MVNSITELLLEEATLDWFKGLGYAILHGPDITPDTPNAERSTYANIVLIERLRSALERINPKIPLEAIEDAIGKITRTESHSLSENNCRFHTQMTRGVCVEYQAQDNVIYGKAWLIDFDQINNNDWLPVNQFPVIEDKENRHPDVVAFINGLSVGTIKLKNSSVDRNAIIRKAFKRLQTYKQDRATLTVP